MSENTAATNNQSPNTHEHNHNEQQEGGFFSGTLGSILKFVIAYFVVGSLINLFKGKNNQTDPCNNNNQ
jgi:hypothetical protein